MCDAVDRAGGRKGAERGGALKGIATVGSWENEIRARDEGPEVG